MRRVIDIESWTVKERGRPRSLIKCSTQSPFSGLLALVFLISLRDIGFLHSLVFCLSRMLSSLSIPVTNMIALMNDSTPIIFLWDFHLVLEKSATQVIYLTKNSRDGLRNDYDHPGLWVHLQVRVPIPLPWLLSWNPPMSLYHPWK